MKMFVDTRLINGVTPNYDYGRHIGLTEQETVNSAEMTLSEMESALDRQKVVHLEEESLSIIACECGRAFSKRKREGLFRVKEEDRVNYCQDCGVRLNWRRKN